MNYKIVRIAKTDITNNEYADCYISEDGKKWCRATINDMPQVLVSEALNYNLHKNECKKFEL